MSDIDLVAANLDRERVLSDALFQADTLEFVEFEPEPEAVQPVAVVDETDDTITFVADEPVTNEPIPDEIAAAVAFPLDRRDEHGNALTFEEAVARADVELTHDPRIWLGIDEASWTILLL